MPSDDRQRLRREALTIAHAHPGELRERERVRNKHILALESLLVEAEKRPFVCKDCGAAGRWPGFIHAMRCAGCWKARAEKAEASAEEAHRDAASLRLRIERLVNKDKEIAALRGAAIEALDYLPTHTVRGEEVKARIYAALNYEEGDNA